MTPTMARVTPLNVSTACPQCRGSFRRVGDVSHLQRSHTKAVLDLSCPHCGVEFEFNMVTGQTAVNHRPVAPPVPPIVPVAPPAPPPPRLAPLIEDWAGGGTATSTPAATGFAPMLDHPEQPPEPPEPPAKPRGFAPLLEPDPPPAPKTPPPKADPRPPKSADRPPEPPAPPPPVPAAEVASPRPAAPNRKKKSGLSALPKWAQWAVIFGAVALVAMVIFQLPVIPSRGGAAPK